MIYASPSCLKVHGYSPEEFKDIKLKDLLTPESFYYVNHVLKEELEYDKNPHAEPTRTRTILIKERHKHGHIIWTENQVSFVRDENNKPKAIIGVTRDVTHKLNQIKSEKPFTESPKQHTQQKILIIFLKRFIKLSQR